MLDRVTAPAEGFSQGEGWEIRMSKARKTLSTFLLVVLALQVACTQSRDGSLEPDAEVPRISGGSLVMREPQAGFESFARVFAWNGIAGSSIRNVGPDPVKLVRVETGVVDGIEVDGIYVVGPQPENVSLQASVGWPPKYGSDAEGTSYVIQESELQQVEGFRIPGGGDSVESVNLSNPDGPSDATVIFKARLSDGREVGQIHGFTVHYEEADGSPGFVTYDLPLCLYTVEPGEMPPSPCSMTPDRGQGGDTPQPLDPSPDSRR